MIEDDDKHSRFWDVVDNLMKIQQEDWEPAIYTSSYTTRVVPEAGILPYQVTITWIIPSRTLRYQTELSKDIQDRLHKLKTYPQYIVPPLSVSIIELSNFEINSGMNLGAYIAKNYIVPMILDDVNANANTN